MKVDIADGRSHNCPLESNRRSETVGTGDDAVTYTASSYGTVGFTPDADADGFVAYDDLTESAVLVWVHESVDQDATEATLTANIEAQKNPVSADGMPW